MIVFRTVKEFSHFAVEAPRVTSSFSARLTTSFNAILVSIALYSQCSERSFVVVGFVFSSHLNFETYVLATSNSASTLVRSTKSKKSCTIFTSKKLLFLG